MRRIAEAAASPTTSRLMVSPLQVAILLALVDQRGDAPGDRWSLFERYFLVVLEREQGKAGPIGETMRRWGSQIEWLHHRVGFHLHEEWESRGSAEADLTRAELRDLLVGQLAEVDFEGAELERIATELLDASTDRLVLLVQREEGRFSFEVRSLQEFMAAAFLMTGPETAVQQRLEAIAKCSHWLHVFQIAASRCFATAGSRHLRDTILTICRSFNEAGDEIDRYLRTGSRLALGLLEDGLARDAPKYRRLLLSLALDLLATGPRMLPPSLARHCAEEPSLAAERLRSYAASTDEAPRQAAWLVLMQAGDAGHGWAIELLRDLLPTDPTSSAAIVSLARGVPGEGWRKALLRGALERASVGEIAEQVVNTDPDREDRRGTVARLFPCLALLSGRSDAIQAVVDIGGNTPLSFKMVSVAMSEHRGRIYDDLPQTAPWRPMRALARFHRAPGGARLAALLRDIEANGWLEQFGHILQSLPWPLATAVRRAIAGEPLLQLADEAEGGGWGDVSDWHAAERRWQLHGIVEEDLLVWVDGRFVDHRVAQVGAPWTSLSLEHEGAGGGWIERLLDLALRSRGETRRHFRSLVLFVTGLYRPDRALTLPEARLLLEKGLQRFGDERLEADVLQNFPPELLEQPEVLADLERWGRKSKIYLGDVGEPWEPLLVERLIRRLETHPGLLAFLGSMLSASNSPLELFRIQASTLTLVKAQGVPVLSGYSRIFSSIGNASADEVPDIFTLADEEGFTLALLRIILEGDRLDMKTRLAIGEAVAARLNVAGEPNGRRFAAALGAIADQRLAPFRSDPTRKATGLSGNANS